MWCEKLDYYDGCIGGWSSSCVGMTREGGCWHLAFGCLVCHFDQREKSHQSGFLGFEWRLGAQVDGVPPSSE